MTNGIRTRVRRLSDFDVADLMIRARQAIHGALDADRHGKAEGMLEAWEEMLDPELGRWAERGRELQAGGGLPPEARPFVRRQEFRKSALARLIRAVVREKPRRAERWRFAVRAYARAVADFLERWERFRVLDQQEDELADRVARVTDSLSHPGVARELRTRWSRDEPPLAARRRRLERTRELLRRVEEREERRESAAAERDRLREAVEDWLAGGRTSDLPEPAPPDREADLLRRLLRERDIRQARRQARAVGRDAATALRSVLAAGDAERPFLAELNRRLGAPEA